LNLLNIYHLLRPKHYVKNIFIFLPAFFALKIDDFNVLYATFVAFMAFSIVASGVYVFNDYFDIEADRIHPKKRNRPLASGAIDKSVARFIMTLLFSLGLSLMFFVSSEAAIYLFLYAIMNIAYSIHFKHVAIIDIMIIAVGFVLRLFVGSVVTGIGLSKWIVIMTFFLSLFIALAKRRDDVIIFHETGKEVRKVIKGYSIQFLDTSMAIMASIVIVVYTMYTTSLEVIERIHSEYLYLTAFFVIFGIMRYLQITFVFQKSGSPTTIIFKDKFMMLVILSWALSFYWILYY
jgi:decaprenyl-phosphate phosphoribosyltransferase